jgi:hypothetical protein
MTRLQLWSCGGGRQSAGIAALMLEGQLPVPDHACMVRLEWEVGTVWPYVEAYLVPALQRLGVPFTAIDRRKYATKAFWGGSDGETILLPAYTDQSGAPSKLPEFCSGEWKREVVLRWAALQPGWKARGVDGWVGIDFGEQRRIRAARRDWYQPRYPLVFDRPTRLGGCLAAVERQGWPPPPRSRCHHCPNQSDAEWAELTPAEWEQACALDDSMREVDPHAYLHRSLTPLRLVTLRPEADEGGLFTGGCSSGMCY